MGILGERGGTDMGLVDPRPDAMRAMLALAWPAASPGVAEDRLDCESPDVTVKPVAAALDGRGCFHALDLRPWLRWAVSLRASMAFLWSSSATE